MLLTTQKEVPICQNGTHNSGWHASLNLEISKKGKKSIISKSRQKGPLTVQSPFYPEGSLCHLYLLHPPAGIVGGDHLELNITTHNKGQLLVTTPGATKFYRTNGRQAAQNQYFKLCAGTSLEWLPQETIYYPDARARLQTTVHLEDTATFLGWEIHCLGLPVNGKDFEQGQAEIRLNIYRNKKPLLLEALNITKEKKPFQAAFLQNKPVVGSFVATGADNSLLESLRERLAHSQQDLWAATLLDDMLIVRYLGTSTVQAGELFLMAWKHVRPHILGREATPPRIWAT
ncbi:urease accessory protein UreD [Desulfogranum marinum]|uniref:urease accessory protein UreD n=1 Tax=Desulfogranum marinum TaxID=453220 RepID=UPI0019646750|nr:urease accessory protein UreD [Desulfogranum marinum]MBM9511006.1 urease accessory protein UreD [Desulfogranum marinum]